MSSKEKLTVKLEKNNPCYKEYELSLKCLDEMDYNRTLCSKYFDNYKSCKEFWLFVYRERKRKGEKPYLPEAKDRPIVKQEYLPYFKRN